MTTTEQDEFVIAHYRLVMEIPDTAAAERHLSTLKTIAYFMADPSEIALDIYDAVLMVDESRAVDADYERIAFAEFEHAMQSAIATAITTNHVITVTI
jgi:hypothetical protein